MAKHTTINGTEYKVSWNGSIQITDSFYITYKDRDRKWRGETIKTGWAVYHNDGDSPRSQHGEDQAAAAAAAHNLQVQTDARRAEREAKQAAEAAATAEREALIKEKGPLATPRQVDFIMTLIAQGRREEGGWYDGPTTHAEITKMGRKEASLYIDSLTART